MLWLQEYDTDFTGLEAAFIALLSHVACTDSYTIRVQVTVSRTYGDEYPAAYDG